MKFLSCLITALLSLATSLAYAERIETHEPIQLEYGETLSDCARKMAQAILNSSKEYSQVVASDFTLDRVESWVNRVQDGSSKYYFTGKDQSLSQHIGHIWVTLTEKAKLQPDGSRISYQECTLAEAGCTGSFLMTQGWQNEISNDRDCPSPPIGY